MLFHIRSFNFENYINPDITGNMIKSIIDSTEILRNSNMPADASKSSSQGLHKRANEHNTQRNEMDFENVSFNEENCKILMNLIRTSGRYINILDIYRAYEAIYKKYTSVESVKQKSSQ